ncbi:MAG: hypothetical protein ACE5R4_02125, partial [Armatimonadota bacterium]
MLWPLVMVWALAVLAWPHVAWAQAPGDLPVRPEDTPAGQRRQRASAMVEEAKALARDGRFAEALEKLRGAATEDPGFRDPYQWMGHVYEQLLQREQAVERGEELRARAIAAYCQALEVSAGDEHSASRLAALFFQDQFPRVLYPQALTRGPAGFVFGNCFLRSRGDQRTATRSFAYTASVIFPPELPEGAGPARWPVDPRGLAQYNRVSYGFVLEPDEEKLVRRLTIYYPSKNLARVGREYGPLAARAANLLLRFYWYGREYLGAVATRTERRPEGGMGEQEARLWLTEVGEAGGEQAGRDLFLYEVNRDRAPVEWMRELAHEWGHLILPRVGGFTEPEPTAEGMLAERLLLGWLADEVAETSGERLPGAKAQRLLDAMWGDSVELGPFLRTQTDESVREWLVEGPESALMVAPTREGMDYFVGFAQYVAAAHGEGMLASTFGKLEGQAVADFVRAYKQAVTEAAGEQGVPIEADVYVPPATAVESGSYSRLARSDGILLAPEGFATYWAYTSAGKWHLLAECDPQEAELVVSVDGAEVGRARLTPVGGKAGCELGELTDRWHRLTVQVASSE